MDGARQEFWESVQYDFHWSSIKQHCRRWCRQEISDRYIAIDRVESTLPLATIANDVARMSSSIQDSLKDRLSRVGMLYAFSTMPIEFDFKIESDVLNLYRV